MPQSHGYGDFTYKAAADLSTKQYHGVIASADNTVAIASTAAEAFVGVLQNAPAVAGYPAVVRHPGSGTSLVCAGAAFAAGARLTTNSAGRFVAATTGQLVHGRAKEAAGADGDLVEAVLEISRES